MPGLPAPGSWPCLQESELHKCLCYPLVAVSGKSETKLKGGKASFTKQKAMATHSSVLAWRIPGTEEPGRLPSMGSHRVGRD